MGLRSPVECDGRSSTDATKRFARPPAVRSCVVLRAVVIGAIALSASAAWRNVNRRLDGARFGALAVVFRLNRTAAWILPVFFVLAALLLDDALSSESGIEP